MKTARLIILTAAIIACAAPAASARPAIDPPARAAEPVNSASIAAHHEQLSTDQYLASHGRSVEATPLTDRTGSGSDGRFPVAFVLIGIAIPLALGFAASAAVPHADVKGVNRPSDG